MLWRNLSGVVHVPATFRDRHRVGFSAFWGSVGTQSESACESACRCVFAIEKLIYEWWWRATLALVDQKEERESMELALCEGHPSTPLLL